MKSDVRRLRSARGWSQAELGERPGVARPTVIAIERERCDPSLPPALRIAKLFAVRVEEAFHAEDA